MLEQLCPRILDYTHVQKVTVYRKKAHLRITCKYIRISYHCGGGGSTGADKRKNLPRMLDCWLFLHSSVLHHFLNKKKVDPTYVHLLHNVSLCGTSNTSRNRWQNYSLNYDIYSYGIFIVLVFSLVAADKFHLV